MSCSMHHRNNSPTLHRQPPIQPHPYQQHLEQGTDPPPLNSATIRYWSDYNRVYFHPRSLVPVSLTEIPSTSELSSFGNWSTGEELFTALDKEHDLLDRDVRYFAEECDQLQAFQVFANIGDAWGGWTASWLERLRDDYGKIGIWTWGLESKLGDTRVSVFLCLELQWVDICRNGDSSTHWIPLDQPQR